MTYARFSPVLLALLLGPLVTLTFGQDERVSLEAMRTEAEAAIAKRQKDIDRRVTTAIVAFARGDTGPGDTRDSIVGLGAAALAAGEVERQADHQAADFVFVDQLQQSVAKRRETAAAAQGLSCGGDGEAGVGNSDAERGVADVESHEAGGGREGVGQVDRLADRHRRC